MDANVGVPIVKPGLLAEALGVSASIPLLLAPDDKLDVLRFLDEFHYWQSLDDERVCQRCGRTITGRQIVVIELQGTRGKLRLQCPTVGCPSTVSEWTYANPVQAAKLRMAKPAASDNPRPKIIAQERTHHGEQAAKRKVAAAAVKRRHSIFAPAPSFRAALARLVLVRPLATALHAFRPIS